ncbi:MAG TPA: SAM-dependent chlorinase/fluorinase, partial [Dehalococcoidia bacterium]|nr:SAM-dependent chlorinase/fluorinase [Dehalococcoidia bacterium]
MRLITLTTDFGLADAYVGEVKGVIHSIAPAATIVDISHEVPPQAIEEGAFVLAAAWRYFPVGTVHVAVVDPGVGTERAAIAVVTEQAVFVGPDNGVLSAALPEEARKRAGAGPRRVALPRGTAAFLLTNERFQRQPVSATFHGRDIFAPAAAHIASGVRPEEMGPRATEVT